MIFSSYHLFISDLITILHNLKCDVLELKYNYTNCVLVRVYFSNQQRNIMIIKELYSPNDFSSYFSRDDFIHFLFTHLDKFGDPKEDISNCLDYAFGINGGQGGFALAALEDGKIIGALILNKTGMSGFIPENILVYVAVDASMRGKGIGRKICEKCIDLADGDVKLHVEYDNPAKRLYERLGFTNKYAEMRLKKSAEVK